MVAGRRSGGAKRHRSRAAWAARSSAHALRTGEPAGWAASAKAAASAALTAARRASCSVTQPTATGTGGPGYSTVDPPPKSARYTHGVVAMAKTGTDPPGTAGSQFFVVTAKDAALPPDYAVVGKVTSGLDVVDRIGKLGDASEQPTQPIVIDHVRVQTS